MTSRKVKDEVTMQLLYERLHEIEQKLDTRLSELTEQVRTTNGKVKLHGVMVAGVWTAIAAIVAGFVWMANLLVKHVGG